MTDSISRRRGSRRRVIGLVLAVAPAILWAAAMQIFAGADLRAAVTAGVQALQVAETPPPGCAGLALTQPPALFDLRIFETYDAAAARAYLCALEAGGPQGRRALLDAHFPLDMVFPVLYGAAASAAIAFFARSGGGMSRGLIALLLLAPLLAMICDWGENLAVRGLALAGPEALDPGAVATASALTFAKWVAVALTVCAVGAAALRAMLRRKPDGPA